MSQYQTEHSPTHHADHPIFISFFYLPRSIASSLFKLRAWQSFCTTSVHVLFGLPLGLEPSICFQHVTRVTELIKPLQQYPYKKSSSIMQILSEATVPSCITFAVKLWACLIQTSIHTLYHQKHQHRIQY